MSKKFDPYGDTIDENDIIAITHTVVVSILAGFYVQLIQSTGHGLWFDTTSTYFPWLLLEGFVAFWMVMVYYVWPIFALAVLWIFLIANPLLKKFKKWINTEPVKIKERKPLVKRTRKVENAEVH